MNWRASERRLAAVLMADVVGYSHMMGVDEEGTLARLKSLRAELIDHAVRQFRGRIVKSIGDGVLVEFASTINAVRCAIAVQHSLDLRNAELSLPEQIWLRIGVNAGELMVERDGDVFGDSVNIAARLESIAPPGGLCVSGAVRDQVGNQITILFEDWGERSLKNIAQPVRVFAIKREALANMAPVGALVGATQSPFEAFSKPFRVGSAVLVSIVVLAGLWLLGHAVSHRAKTSIADAIRPLDLPNVGEARVSRKRVIPKLSIVVLPFGNAGNDPDQDYFAENLTSDITTDLSRIEGSFVIASETALAYKGRLADPRRVARDLGVGYALTGIVRRIGDQVRVTAELMDASTGGQIWSDRFDGDRRASVDFEDKVTARIARSLDLRLTDAESRRAENDASGSVDASDIAMRGWSALNRPISEAQLEQAEDLFKKSLELDPCNVRARLGLARTLANKVNSRLSNALKDDLARAEALDNSVINEHPADAMAQFVRAELLRARKQFVSAINTYETATSLDRNFAPAYGGLASALLRAGRSAEAIEKIETAIELSPRDPLLSFWLYTKGHAYAHLARDQESVDWCLKSLAAPAPPYWLNYVDLASSYAWLGRIEEAKSAVHMLLDLKPGYTVARWRDEGWSNDPTFLREYQRITEGLRKAGLPDR